MALRTEEKQKMAAVLQEATRRIDIIKKERAAYQEVEQDLERMISDLQLMLAISEPGGGDPPLLRKLKQGIHEKRDDLESSLDETMERLSEHQRLEPNVVPLFRKEVGLLMENLPLMDEFSPLVISDLERDHPVTKYIIIRRLDRTMVRRGSGNPAQIIQDSAGKYIPSWKQWEKRTLSQFFESDINSSGRIEKALNALLEFYSEHTKGVKVGGEGGKAGGE
jgi:hypothetical protein